jgi:microcystin-dependent protein
VGSGHTLGERGGEQAHTVSVSELPTHTHVARGRKANGSTPIPAGNLLASANNLYDVPTNLLSLHPSTVTNTGGSQAHLNMQPFLTVSFCIALQGIFPSAT